MLHLLFEMQDRHEKAWGRESEAKGQAATSHRVARGELGSGVELPPGLPAKLPKLPEGDGTLTKPSNPAPEASNQGKKCPLDADNEVIELDHEEATPKKKKKKKNKSKDKSKDETLHRKPRMTGHMETTSAAEPEVVTEEPVPVFCCLQNSGGGDQGSEEEKEEECRTREVPIRAEGS